MSLTREQVEKVALLARLQLSDKELDTMTAQLGQIVRGVGSVVSFRGRPGDAPTSGGASNTGSVEVELTDAAVRTVAGTARSMGIESEGVN